MVVNSSICPAAGDPIDRALVQAIQHGLPIAPRPYAEVAEELGISEAEVLARLARLIDDGTIKRFGVVVRHQELGYRANAMVVWVLPEERVAELGRRIGSFPFVTLSYRRPPRLPDWPYNLFTMIHGRDRAGVLSLVDRIKERCELASVDCAVLFSGRRFKQRGAQYGASPRQAPAATQWVGEASLQARRP
jgi:DNA-binding Lrp family transcriptional regulator